MDNNGTRPRPVVHATPHANEVDEAFEYYEQRGRDIGYEMASSDHVRAAARALAVIAATTWRFGDGCGGWVLEVLAEEADAVGLSVWTERASYGQPLVHKLARRDGWDCHYCGHPLGWGSPVVRQPEADHVIPRAHGGPDSITNRVLACFKCNRDKHARTPVEWLGEPCCEAHQ